MSPSPIPQSSFPYTITSIDSADSNSFTSLFATMSENMDPQFTGGMSPEQSSKLASLGNAVNSQNAQQSNTLGSSSPTTLVTSTSLSQTTASTGVANSAVTAVSSQSVSASTPDATSSPAVSTSATPTVSITSTAATSSTASSAANNSSSDLHAESSSGMSSPGMQAAVAVPIVVVVLAAVALIFFCMRRRRKRGIPADDAGEKAPVGAAAAAASRKSKWTRHLRMFSFDTELLMGGRYSSTNSIRSRQTGSVRSNAQSTHSGSPSVHSIDEVAPPYRDAVTAARPPSSMAQVLASAAAGGAVAAGVNRSASNATAPPPYGAAAGRLSTPTSPTTPQSQRASHQNPFADSPLVSPVEGSPFNDPPDTSPPISRNSSLYRSDRDETSTLGGASDAASIREATLARNTSVMSGARMIHNVNRQASQ